MLSPDLLAERRQELREAKREKSLPEIVIALLRNSDESYFEAEARRHHRGSEVTEIETSMYKLVRRKHSLRVEGIFASGPERTKDVRRMTPVDVLPNGTLFSEGGRISPLDQRITAIALDLDKARKMPAGDYEKLADHLKKPPA